MMRLRWLGHATVLIDLDGARLLTDPLLTESMGPFVRRRTPLRIDLTCLDDIDAVLISHAHPDHLHLQSLRRLPDGARILVPEGLGPWMRTRGFRHAEEIAEGASTCVGDLRVLATPARHQGWRPPFGPRADAIGFALQGRSTVYFAGDTDVFEQMRLFPDRLGGHVDVALLPVGGWGPTLRGGHMDPVRAAEAVRLLRPSRAIPIHWGTFWPAGLRWLRPERFHLPGAAFRARVSEVAPEVTVHVPRPGEEVVIDDI